MARKECTANTECTGPRDRLGNSDLKRRGSVRCALESQLRTHGTLLQRSAVSPISKLRSLLGELWQTRDGKVLFVRRGGSQD